MFAVCLIWNFRVRVTANSQNRIESNRIKQSRINSCLSSHLRVGQDGVATAIDVEWFLVDADAFDRVDALSATVGPPVEHIVDRQSEIKSVLVPKAVQQIGNGGTGSFVRLQKHYLVVRHLAWAR